MRAARFVFRPARMTSLALIFALTLASTSVAETAAFVDIRGDSTVAVEAAAHQPGDQVLLFFADGTERLVMTHRIRKITDMQGRDRTRFVMDGRGTVGALPAGYKSPVSAGSPLTRPILTGVLVGAGAFAVLLVLVNGLSGHSNETNP